MNRTHKTEISKLETRTFQNHFHKCCDTKTPTHTFHFRLSDFKITLLRLREKISNKSHNLNTKKRDLREFSNTNNKHPLNHWENVISTWVRRIFEVSKNFPENRVEMSSSNNPKLNPTNHSSSDATYESDTFSLLNVTEQNSEDSIEYNRKKEYFPPLSPRSC